MFWRFISIELIVSIGKTVQVIAFICSLLQDGAPGPFLVVAPLSTLTNWCTEFARFAPNVNDDEHFIRTDLLSF